MSVSVSKQNTEIIHFQNENRVEPKQPCQNGQRDNVLRQNVNVPGKIYCSSENLTFN